MSHRSTRLALALTAALALGGCAAPRTVVGQAPPQPRSDVPPPSPGAHVVWHSGHWAWDADKSIYFWEAGRWAEERPGQVWIPGYWERVEEDGVIQGWAWVDPRWEPGQR